MRLMWTWAALVLTDAIGYTTFQPKTWKIEKGIFVFDMLCILVHSESMLHFSHTLPPATLLVRWQMFSSLGVHSSLHRGASILTTMIQVCMISGPFRRAYLSLTQ